MRIIFKILAAPCVLVLTLLVAVGSPPFHTTNGGWDQPPFSASSGHRDQNSAHDEAPQGAVQLVQLGKQPSGQRRQAKG